MKTANLGFNSELVINLNYGSLWGMDFPKRQQFRQQLMQNPGIKGVAFSNGIMGAEDVKRNLPEGLKIGDIKKQISFIGIDPDFFDVMEIELLEGRNFSRERTSDFWGDRGDQAGKVIFNETAVREFELEIPVGTFAEWANGLQLEIVGVVSDFNFISQHKRIEPFMYCWFRYMKTVSIKIAPTDIPASLRIIEKEFESLFPDEVFEYSFLDETYAYQYFRDEKTARIISNFAIIAVLIACLGLFGLSSFMAARRTKEIGIRKAMGASVQSLFLLLSREFIKWVAISIVIACPLAWFIMNKWLQSFAYRTNIGVWIFVLAIIIAFAIAFLTVTWQSLKTSRTNPVEALRYE
jgi:putative ABC transport system permease protein